MVYTTPKDFMCPLASVCWPTLGLLSYVLVTLAIYALSGLVVLSVFVFSNPNLISIQ